MNKGSSLNRVDDLFDFGNLKNKVLKYYKEANKNKKWNKNQQHLITIH